MLCSVFFLRPPPLRSLPPGAEAHPPGFVALSAGSEALPAGSEVLSAGFEGLPLPLIIIVTKKIIILYEATAPLLQNRLYTIQCKAY